MQNLWASLWK